MVRDQEVASSNLVTPTKAKKGTCKCAFFCGIVKRDLNRALAVSNNKEISACFLADNGNIPVRVAVFSGSSKADKLFSVKELGNTSLISSIDRIIDYSDSINIPKAVEHLDTGYREDISLFNQECFNEAVKNAFIHNNWLHRVAPMITFYDDRVEIISFSKLAPNQTLNGFYNGHSIPVNEDLSTIFWPLT